MGASTAHALAERGHNVALFEQFSVGHNRGSSHGHSRIIRKAYPDAFYTGIMNEAYPMWHELQRLSTELFVFEPGLLYFGSFESQTLRDVLSGLEQVGVPHEVMDADWLKRLFPRLVVNDQEIGIFTPEAGWVHAGKAVQAICKRLRDLGAVILEGAKADVERLATDFDAYVLCPGPWIREYVDVPVQVTLQTIGYVDDGQAMSGPVWIEDCDEFFYGFPSEAGRTAFKIGVHQHGPPAEPAESERLPGDAHVAAIADVAKRRFAIDEGIFSYQTCLYTNTGDEDFLLGRHGENGYFASPCSGHGFKFGPWIGAKLADFVEGRDAPENHPRFCWPPVKLEA